MDKENVNIYNELLRRHERDEKLSFTTTWVELEVLMLTEISQAQKDNYRVLSLIGEV